MKLVFRRGKVYHGSTKYDKGFTRPVVLDSTNGSDGGGISGAGTPQTIYPAGPPSGSGGVAYVNTVTGDVSWWYNGQWN